MERDRLPQIVMAWLIAVLWAGFAASQPTGASQQQYSQVVARETLHLTDGDEKRLFAEKGELLIVLGAESNGIAVQSSAGVRAVLPKTDFVSVKDAAPIYDQLIREKPNEVNLYLLRSHVWALCGENQKAIDDCTQALQLDAKQPHVYVNRGVFFASMGKFDEAIADYQQAMKQGAKGEPVYINLAAALVAQQRYSEAVKVYNRVIEMSAKEAKYYVQRGIAYRYQRDWDKAIADFNTALQIDSSNLAAFSSRGFVYYLKADHKRAVADFDQVIRQQPDNAMAYNNRGFNRQMLGDYKHALKDYDRAIQRNPKYAMAHQNKAWLLATCPDDAVRDGFEAYKAAKAACDLRQWKVYSDIKALAAAYAESGDFTHAVEFQQMVISMTDGEQRSTEQEMLKLYQAGQPYRLKIQDPKTDS